MVCFLRPCVAAVVIAIIEDNNLDSSYCNHPLHHLSESQLTERLFQHHCGYFDMLYELFLLPIAATDVLLSVIVTKNWLPE